ncbi:MAG: helix-turn-helix domain-containing protein [Muribaculaceae bacterium]|nr:helix-turn-helix domain-containing protein [Muribaculaceae bacterium]
MNNNLNMTDLIGSNVSIQVKIEDLQDFARQILLGVQSIAREQAELATRADKLLTVQEAAQMLSVSKMTLHRWDKNGILKKVEIGGKRRYRLSDIEKRAGCKLNPGSNVSK